MKTSPRRSRISFVLAMLTLAFTLLFAAGNFWALAVSDLQAGEYAALVLLITSQTFLIFHGFVYFSDVARVTRNEVQSAPPNEEDVLSLDIFPPTAFVMCSYREPLSVIEQNMLCFRNLSYPAKQLYLLDDTRYTAELDGYRRDIEALCQRMEINLFRRRWRGAKAGLINDFLQYLAGRDEPGFEFTAYQEDKHSRGAKYLAVFDIDMNPLPTFADPLIALLEADERLAFVQTPQFYSNIMANRVAYGASFQQAIFYEYICEGKGLQNAMPCCGTNVMFRIAALEDVGGMEERSITEDFATSFRMHLRGWRSAYLRRVCVFGMGPQDLGSFFRQQSRWAAGMVGLLPIVLKEFFRHPRALPPMRWVEYLASVSYYCVGLAWLVIWLFPITFIFFGFPRNLAQPQVFFTLFIPYFVLTMWTFFASLKQRGYSVRETFTALAMNAISFPVYLKASLCGLMGIRGEFKVTAKTGADALPIRFLWPHLLACSLALAAIVWGLNHLAYGTSSAFAIAMNLFWCIYNGVLIGTVFYFNHPTGPIRAFGNLTAACLAPARPGEQSPP